MAPHMIAPSRDRAPFTTPIHKQLAALCWRAGKKSAREVLLVTSSHGRWILPKGWPIDGLSASEAALVEAWEEGGVRKGKVGRKPLGAFLGSKLSDAGDEEPCLIKVYEVEVRKIEKDYPEADERDRRWVTPEKAMELVTEDGLRRLLRKFG